MIDIAKLAATVRRVAAEQPLYRLETKTHLIAAADVLDQLTGPDPKVAPLIPTEASFKSTSEASGGATAGPGSTCDLCGLVVHSRQCPRGIVESLVVKMNAAPSESERVPMAESEPIKVILKMEDSPYQS